MQPAGEQGEDRDGEQKREIARLQAQLDAIHASSSSSSSWKIAREVARPFRRFHRSISRLAASLDRRLDVLFVSTSSKVVREAVRPFLRISRSLSSSVKYPDSPDF